MTFRSSSFFATAASPLATRSETVLTTSGETDANYEATDAKLARFTFKLVFNSIS
jgi:hypothetical protein